jgi:predicted phage baseplate assembly protein
MPFPDIQLDDRTFETLVTEAKRRIPGYTPEWTDLNESDPGVTLLQLFAWLEEMILWRLNRVPEKNFIEFLKLIGIELAPPAPAKTQLTFALSTPEPPNGYVLIPQGTKISPTEQIGDRPVIFQTDDNLYAVGGKLKALQSFDGARFKLLEQANGMDGKYYLPFDEHPQPESAFYLGFDRAFPSTSSQSRQDLLSHVLTINVYTGGLTEEGQGVSADLPAPTPPVIAVWEYWAGAAAAWQPLDVTADTTAGLTRTGFVKFNAPADAATTRVGLERKPDDTELFWYRYHIDDVLPPGYEVAPRLEDVLINTVGATNAVTVSDEFLGASDGSPSQIYALANKPVLLDGFILQIDEGDGFNAWTRVDDFAGSKPTDQHFTLKPSTGEIAFGDGEQGKIPARHTDPSRPDQDLTNIKAATYRWGGGAQGNVGAKKVTSLKSPVPYVDSVTNFRSTSGGQDEESVDDAKVRAPQSIRTQSRAVTADDFAFLATQTPGARIRRAHALPQHNPHLQPTRPARVGLPATPVPIPGAITVAVVPDSHLAKPVPSEETCLAVARWLNAHRLITTELYVVPPRYRKVEIEVRVIVETNANSGQVAQMLGKRLLEYFNPLTGGRNGSGWEFGGVIYFSETYRTILDTPGVARIEAGAVKTRVNDQLMDSSHDIPLQDDELVYSENHRIFASYS